MSNEIMLGIAKALRTEFGTKYKIYTEQVKQGFEEPCFFILELEDSFTPYIGYRGKYTALFDIHYFPDSRFIKNQEMQNVASRLYGCMRFIDSPVGKLRGMSMHSEITEDTLHFMVNFPMVVREKSQTIDFMEEVSTNAKTRD
ncbi:MAG: hypothetical protein KHZ62_09605 [Clostridiales bacterium]|nr:hypothetical protein [Clostridiales bacterium]